MIRPVVFTSYDQGELEEDSKGWPACFSIVKKYPLLYEAYRKERQRIRPFYGHPYTEQLQKPYYGTDRSGRCLFRDELRDPVGFREKRLLFRLRNETVFKPGLVSELDAKRYLGMQMHPEEFEIIHVKLAGTDDAYPEAYEFLGYDISYTVGCDGAFSIICDCLFLPQWHGCDLEGTLFSEDFEKLNENGLFSDWDDAYAYLVKYRNEDWSEMGQFAIYEVRRKKE